jgi:hypothetical protein
MRSGLRCLVSKANAAANPRHLDNRVGAGPVRVGGGRPGLVSVVCASLSVAGCGARSELPGGSGPCPDGRATPSGMVLGPGSVAAVAADRCGYPVVVGAAMGTLAFDGVAIAPQGENSGVNDAYFPGTLFLARLGLSPFGLAFTPQWPPSHPLVNDMRVAVDDEGSVLVAADVNSPVDLGGGPVGATVGQSSIFARFSPAGEHVFSGALVGSGGIDIGRPAYDAEGNVFFAGAFVGALTLDGAPLDGSSMPLAGGGYVVEFDPRGTLLWSKVFAGPELLGLGTLTPAVWADGSLALTGTLGIGELDLGDGPFWNDTARGFVATFGPSGDYRWAQILDLGLLDAHVDASDTLAALGSQTDSGIPVVHVAAGGSVLGQSLFPLPFMANLILQMGVDARGDVLGVENAGSGLAAVEQSRVGQVLWNRPISATGGVYALATFGGTPTPVLAGGFQGTLDLGTGPLTPLPGVNGAATDSVFVAVLPP